MTVKQLPTTRILFGVIWMVVALSACQKRQTPAEDAGGITGIGTGEMRNTPELPVDQLPVATAMPGLSPRFAAHSSVSPPAVWSTV